MNVDKGFQAYVDYVGIKLHFNSEKFIWNPTYKYSTISFSSYLKRNDRWLFAKLTSRYQNRDSCIDYLISSFLYDKSSHVSSLIDNYELSEYHFDRLSKIKALAYTFEQDVDHISDYLFENQYSIKDALISKGERPLILKDINKIYKGVSNETLSLIDKAFHFTLQPKIDPLWEEESLQILKYNQLITIENTNQFKTTLKKLYHG